MSHIIITDDPKHMPLILLDGVEGVLLKRSMLKAAQRAVERHDFSKYDLSKENLRLERARLEEREGRPVIDGSRIYIANDNMPRGLKPLVEERESVTNLFADAMDLEYEPEESDMRIQPARRREGDTVFHRDLVVNLSQREVRDFSYVFASSVHHGRSTQVLPSCDAGPGRASKNTGRMYYSKPTSLENMVSAQPGDILVCKFGKGGSVHRAPNEGDQVRAWSYIQTQSSVHELRQDFGRALMNTYERFYEDYVRGSSPVVDFT